MARPSVHLHGRPHSVPVPARSHALGRDLTRPQVAGLRFALPRPSGIDVHVVDATQRRVRTLLRQPIPAGEHECAWDGHDDDGIRCPAGTYVLRLETDGHLLTSRIVVLR